MKNLNITSQLVRDFWEYMLISYNASAVDKSDSAFMKIVGEALDLIKVMNKEEFMEVYTTTIPPNIYIPFVLGADDGNYSLWSQITVCVHECQHMWQSARDGQLKFSFEYLTNKQSRAEYEAEAWRCDLEMNYWRTGKLPDVDKYAKRILDYGCGTAEVQFIREYLNMSIPTILHDGMVSHASQTAITWLGHYVQQK